MRAARSDGAPRLAAVTVGYLFWSLGPIAVAILFSFNAGRSIDRWEGFSLHWWTSPDPFSPGLLHDADLMAAFRHSIVLAAICTVIVIPIGTAFALGWVHLRWGPIKVVLVLMVLPLALPPVALATSLKIMFLELFRSVPFGHLGWFGTRGQVAGLVALYLPLATIVIVARLLLMDRHGEEIGADLGAPPTDVVRRVILPQLRPAILAASTVVFATALGEFVVVDVLVGKDDTRALAPALLGARNGPTPSDNAIGSILAVAGLVSTAALVLAFRSAIPGRDRQAPGGTT
jgi:spermidine/putrescine transport system permease protein